MNDQDLSHRHTWELIPLVVNGSASDRERALVQTHLHDCPDCRDEFAFQLQLQAGMTDAAAATHDPQPALARMLARIDAEDAAPAVRRPARRQPLLLVALAAQAVALALLGVMLLGRPGVPTNDPAAARYRTLSTPAAAPSHATIRLVPAPTLTLRELQALLAESGLRIVESNADNAIYGLAPANVRSADDPARATADAVARLRARPGVLLAEPIAASANER